MHWRSAFWGILAGFCIAVTLIAELGRPYVIFIFVCGAVTRVLLGLAIKEIWGADLKTLWHRHQPDQVQFWRHAWAYIKGEHTERDPLKCRPCRG